MQNYISDEEYQSISGEVEVFLKNILETKILDDERIGEEWKNRIFTLDSDQLRELYHLYIHCDEQELIQFFTNLDSEYPHVKQITSQNIHLLEESLKRHQLREEQEEAYQECLKNDIARVKLDTNIIKEDEYSPETRRSQIAESWAKRFE